MTNVELRSLTGTVVVVRDLALALQRRGHRVVVYAPQLGHPADELLRRGISVVNRLDTWDQTPDIIHAQHTLPAMLAMARFPDTPAIWMQHGRVDWFDAPPPFRRIHRYLAVDTLRRDILLNQYAIPPERVEILRNAVDLTRFEPRAAPLPREAKMLLLFAKTDGVLQPLMAANESLGLAVRAIGMGVRRPTNTPEQYLATADIVVATGRMAIEAICAGAAVVVADLRGVAGMVTLKNYDALQAVNFGATALTGKLSPAALRAEIRKYDPREAGRVSRRLREEADLEKAVDRLEQIYREAVAANRSGGWTANEARAVGKILEEWPAKASSPEWRGVREQLGKFLEANGSGSAP